VSTSQVEWGGCDRQILLGPQNQGQSRKKGGVGHKDVKTMPKKKRYWIGCLRMADPRACCIVNLRAKSGIGERHVRRWER